MSGTASLILGTVFLVSAILTKKIVIKKSKTIKKNDDQYVKIIFIDSVLTGVKFCIDVETVIQL